jgi:hypothetical protein
VAQQYSKTRHPVRKISTREQIEHTARRQALQEADPSYSGHSAGIHPESRPDSSRDLTPVQLDSEEDFDLEEGDEYYQTRLPTSARRYQVAPEQVYQLGNHRLHVRYVDVPKRKSRVERGTSRQTQLPPAREVYTDEREQTLPAKPKTRKLHSLFTFGVGMIAMLALFMLLASTVNWIQITKDDLTYGRPRTFQMDAVVGHNDSPSNPTHFIALNLNRHVEVIEIPGQDENHERTFNITTLFGDGEDLTPVTLSFRDLTGNGKLDMLIHIQDQTLVMINENGTFRPARPGEVKGLV